MLHIYADTFRIATRLDEERTDDPYAALKPIITERDLANRPLRRWLAARFRR